MKNKTKYTSIIQNLFIQRAIHSFWASVFTRRIIYSTKASSKNIRFVYAEELFFLFSILIHCKNYLSRSHSSKKFKTFSTTFRKHYNITVKVSPPNSKHNSHKKLDTFIHGIKKGQLKTIAIFVLWSWNFYKGLLYLLLHHCPKIRTRTCILLEIP